MIPWLQTDTPFPAVEQALRQPNGLLAAGADLSVQRLLAAYRLGIFPWFGDDEPILWWSPDPRMVLFPDELKISRSLTKTMRRGHFDVRADSAFAQVIAACAAPQPERAKTWISEPMQAAYNRLHQLGWAHSLETWQDGKLVGGLYGVAIGRVFFGESMFSRVSDASKVALVHLVELLRERGFAMIDCQMHTAHLASLGARAMTRREFTRRLTELVNYSDTSDSWSLLPSTRHAHTEE